MSNTPRMTEQEWAEHQRRVRISKSKTGVRRGQRGEATPVGRAGGDGTRHRPSGADSRLHKPASSPASQIFFVPGRLPGANDIIRKHHMVYSRLKTQWGTTIAQCIRAAKIKCVGYCRIEFQWQEPNDNRDDDNVIFAQKFVLDALRDTRIIPDDRRKYIYSLTHRVSVWPGNPGVHVTVIPMCVEV